MTKDNQDEVENALKYLKPCFQNKQCKKKQRKNSQVIGALNPFPRVETGWIVERCKRLSEWKEFTWLVKNGSCMFSIICGPENSKMISSVFIIFFDLILPFSSTMFWASLYVHRTDFMHLSAS